MEESIYTKLSVVQEKLKAPKSNKNSFGNYNYRSAEDILEAVKPLLFETGLVMTISDEMKNLGNRYYVEATVTVTDGKDNIQVTAYAREAETKKGMDDSQITGATSSYARKYALNGMFAIDDTKDADTDEYKRSQDRPKQSKEPVQPFGDKPATEDQKKEITKLLLDQGIFTAEIPKTLAEAYSHPIGAPMTHDKAEEILEDLRK